MLWTGVMAVTLWVAVNTYQIMQEGSPAQVIHKWSSTREIQQEDKYSQPVITIPLWTFSASQMCTLWCNSGCLALVIDWLRSEDLIPDKPIMFLPRISKILDLREQFMLSLVVRVREIRSGSPALRWSLPPPHPNTVERAGLQQK